MASSVASTVAVKSGSISPEPSRCMVGAGRVERPLFPQSIPRLAVEKAMKISPDPFPLIDPIRPMPNATRRTVRLS